MQSFIFYFCCVFLSTGYAKYIAKNLEMCDNNIDYPIKVYVELSMVDDKQFVTGNVTLEVPFDNSIRVRFTIEMVREENEVTQLFSRSEVNACTTAHKYFGELAYDLERRVGLIPGMCPVPQGKYGLHNYPLNLDLIPVQGIPFGNLRFRTTAVKRSDLLLCTIIDVENRLH